jgi:uncharacterized protein
MNDKEDKIRKYAVSLNKERAKFVILPTEKCNFRCEYCYEDFQQGAMSKETIEALKLLLSNRAEKLKLLHIEWFGGEPTLTNDIVLDISAHAQSLTKKHPSLKYMGGMTTNGYLLNADLLKQYCDLGVKFFQISLDGTREDHNETRFLANHEGTFDVIWNNLLAAKTTSLDFTIILRIHFFLENYTNIVPLVEQINNIFLNDTRFKVFFKSIQQLGGKNDSKIPPITYEESERIKDFLKTLITNKKQIYETPISEFVCYAAEPNAMVIRANGEINKCTVALKADYNKVGKLNHDGTVTIDSTKFFAWSKGFQNWEINSLNCPNQYMKKECS